MPTKVEVTDHWTDAGRMLFLAEVKVTTDHPRDFPRLTIEVPDQGSLEAKRRQDLFMAVKGINTSALDQTIVQRYLQV
jgi:hypothetical protein